MADDDVPSEAPAEKTANIQLIRCPSCGQVAVPDSRFCSACGASLSAATGATTSMPAAADASTSGPLPALDEKILAAFGNGEAVLVVHRGPDEGARFPLSGHEMTMGRSPDATIFLDDVTVSRKHAQLSLHGTTWRLTDMGSLNGSYVNRQRIDTHDLENGDEVQIGKYRFIFYQAATS